MSADNQTTEKPWPDRDRLDPFKPEDFAKQMTGWQPIKTAPRDGTPILLYAPPEYVVGQWFVASDGASFWEIGHSPARDSIIALSVPATRWHSIPEGADAD